MEYKEVTFAEIGAYLEAHPGLNRLILKRIDEQTWEITQEDEKRPNDLRKIAILSKGIDYERNAKRGFEALTGYDINQDRTFKVVYRLESDGSIRARMR